MPGKIEFIYFDLGNVILHFNHQIGCKNVAELTGIMPRKAKQIIFDSQLQNDYESGQINTAEFVDRFNSDAGVNVEADSLCRAISDVFSLNRKIIPLITQLVSAQFPIAILSNTCQAHWEFVMDRFTVLQKLFDDRTNVLSYEVKSMKPASNIYQHAIELADVPPEKIFFTDDRIENVAGGNECGIQCNLFSDSAELIGRLRERNIIVNV